MTVEHFLIGLLAALLEAFVVGFFYQHFFIVGKMNRTRALSAPQNMPFIPTMTWEVDRYQARVTRYSNGSRSPHTKPVTALYERIR